MSKFDSLYNKIISEQDMGEEASELSRLESDSTFNSDLDMELVRYTLMDNGDYEYTRLGIGEVNDKTFITDLENDMDEGNTVWAKPGMSVEDVIKAGLKTGIFVVNPPEYRYTEDDIYRYNWVEDGQKSYHEFMTMVTGKPDWPM